MDLLFGRQDFASEACQQNTFLLTNGLGGYCSLSAAFSATRGDHALLMASLRAPTARFDLVHRMSEQLTVGRQRSGCPPRTRPAVPTRTAGATWSCSTGTAPGGCTRSPASV